MKFLTATLCGYRMAMRSRGNAGSMLPAGARESDYGLTIINDAKYGYSVKDNDMRISVVRSPLYGHRSSQPIDPDTEYNWQNQGLQTFRMSLMPHQGGWQDAGVVRAAEEFIAPVPIILQGIHHGSRPQADSLLAVDAPNVVISAIKQAESGSDLIVRCYETAGVPASASIDFRFGRGAGRALSGRRKSRRCG